MKRLFKAFKLRLSYQTFELQSRFFLYINEFNLSFLEREQGRNGFSFEGNISSETKE